MLHFRGQSVVTILETEIRISCLKVKNWNGVVSACISYSGLYLMLCLRHITVKSCSVHVDLICHLKVNCVENKLCHCQPEEMLSKEINYPCLKLCLWSHSLHTNSVRTSSLQHQAEHMSSPGPHQHLCNHPLRQRALLDCVTHLGMRGKPGILIGLPVSLCDSFLHKPHKTMNPCTEYNCQLLS